MTAIAGTAANYLQFLDQLIAALCNNGHAHGKAYTGTGNGTLTGPAGELGGYVGTVDSVAETFTLTATDATTFNVVGSTSGSIGPATVGTAFNHALISFRINAGGTPFIAGDEFKISTSPKWDLVRKHGVSDPTKRTSNMSAAASLWDRNGGTQATLPSGSLPGYAAIEMIGAGPVARFTITVIAAGTAPTAFALEYSDDGVGWTEAQAWSGQTWVGNETRPFNVTTSPGSHKFWRLKFTAVGGVTLAIAGVEFFAQVNSDTGMEVRAEAIVRAPGNDGVSAVYVALEVLENTASDIHNLNFYGFRAYDPSRSVRTQTNNSGLKCVPLAITAFNWWIFANGRRVVAVAKIGTVYVPFYQGLGKPYELPSVHPYPAINAGTGNDPNGAYTATHGDFRGFSCPGRYGFSARYPDQVWREHSNRYQSSSDSADTATAGKIYPSSMDELGNFPNVRDNLDATRPLYEMVVFNRGSPRHNWGELDGCYYTPGFSIVAEQLVSRDGFSHIVFQNCFRVGFNDYFAIRQD